MDHHNLHLSRPVSAALVAVGSFDCFGFVLAGVEAAELRELLELGIQARRNPLAIQSAYCSAQASIHLVNLQLHYYH